MQTALEIYRMDQKNHHEQSIASDLTRCLLRKVFRDTVLQSSKQVGVDREASSDRGARYY